MLSRSAGVNLPVVPASPASALPTNPASGRSNGSAQPSPCARRRAGAPAVRSEANARPARTAAAAVLAAVLASAAIPAAAQNAPAACAGGAIRDVTVDNRSIFNVDEIDPSHRFRRWFLSVANRAHKRTTESFVRNELLFDAGDCLDPLLLEESERVLRSYRFIAEAHVDAVDAGAGLHDVQVQTQDEWSLEINVRPEFDNGLRIARLAVAEENLLGTGTRLALFRHAHQDKRDFGAAWQTPRLFGTRLDASLTGGTTRLGSFFEETVAYPFVAEVGMHAFAETVSLREDYFAYAADPSAPYERLMLPMKTFRVQATTAARLGRPGDFTVLGAAVSWEDLRFDRFPDQVATASGDDLRALEPTDAPILAVVGRQVRPARFLRLSLMAGKRKIRYVKRRGLDPITGEQDVRTGVQALGSLSVERRRQADSFGSGTLGVRGHASLFVGAAGRAWVLSSEFGLEAARQFRDEGASDVVGEVDAHFYWRPGPASRHTVAASFYAAGGWRVSRPFQLTVGGPDRVRGYGRHQFPAGQAAVVNLEDRILLGGALADVVDLSLALFLDAGAGWRGDVPFGQDSGLRAAAGAGLRIGFPAGTQRLPFRLDVAVPLENSGFRSLRYRLGVSAAASLFEGPGDLQTRRSRVPNPALGLAITPPRV